MDVLALNNDHMASPLSIRCAHCGAAARFDVVRQDYHCLFCGGTTSIAQTLHRAERWQEQEQAHRRQLLRDWPAYVYSCPACNARILMETPEHPPVCGVCGSELNCSMAAPSDIPPLILPFRMSEEEARQKLKAWADRHPFTPEARRLKRELGQLEACYLPCQLLRGPVSYEVTRPHTQRHYHCRAFLDGGVVNTSSQVDSLLLDAIGPFDLDAARRPEAEHLSGQKLRLRDLPEAEVERRKAAAAAEQYKNAAAFELQLGDVQLEADCSSAIAIPALLPVYLVNKGKTCAIVNGQTGRFAVTRDKPARSWSWLLEPLILSLLAALLWLYAAVGDLEIFLLGTAACSVLAFCVLADGRGLKLRRYIFHIGSDLQDRCERLLYLDLSGDPPEEPDAPVFFERVDGELTPVKVHYYTPLRVALLLALALAVLLLPVLLAVPIQALRSLGGPVHPVEPAYGAAWYVLALAMILAAWLRLVRNILFDNPILRQLMPDGSVRSLEPVGRERPRLQLWQRLRDLADLDAIAGGLLGVLLVLLGSVLAMIM